MAALAFSFDDLARILREGAGEDEQTDLGGDVLETRFADLGYDSLALLETGSRIERELGITLEDEVIADADTPRKLIDAVNARLAAGAHA
jgi:act minimal PKS acyl carrier protein